MAIDAFLVLTPESGPVLPGETRDQYFSQSQFKATELSAYSFGIHNSTTIGSGSGGNGAGKAQFTDFKVTKVVDSISSDLLQYVGGAGGYSHLKQLDLYLRKSGGAPGSTNNAGFLKYSFKLVYVTDVEWSGGAGDESVKEDVTFAYGALQIIYTAQLPSGQLGKTYIGQWDATTNGNDFNPR
jgi:type VI secretion system secreted protein Hcp